MIEQAEAEGFAQTFKSLAGYPRCRQPVRADYLVRRTSEVAIGAQAHFFAVRIPGAMRKLIDEIDDEFLAKLFVYSRERAYMDHMPAALFVVLVTRDTKLLMHQVFVRVRDNGRVLRTVFRMTRSGQFGRKRRERG